MTAQQAGVAPVLRYPHPVLPYKEARVNRSRQKAGPAQQSGVKVHAITLRGPIFVGLSRAAAWFSRLDYACERYLCSIFPAMFFRRAPSLARYTEPVYVWR
jgi:hypothetical protein